MALVSGFLKQKCLWTQRPAPDSSEFDAYGNPVASELVTIKCRWEFKSGWVRGVTGMSEGSGSYVSYRNKVFVDQAVNPGDELSYTDTNGKTTSGTVLAVETAVGAGGREEARICYV